jgi:type II pantothenate kinase
VLCVCPLQGILAANIFDWGAKACVELYTNGTILDIYREVSRLTSVLYAVSN